MGVLCYFIICCHSFECDSAQNKASDPSSCHVTNDGVWVHYCREQLGVDLHVLIHFMESYSQTSTVVKGVLYMSYCFGGSLLRDIISALWLLLFPQRHFVFLLCFVLTFQRHHGDFCLEEVDLMEVSHMAVFLFALCGC